jgi:hypothetical protein
MTTYSLLTSQRGHARSAVGFMAAAIVTLTLFTGLAALLAQAGVGHLARGVTDPVPQEPHCSA